MEKQCIHCSAPIHEDASFCHACGQSQIVKQVPKLPNPWHKKAMLFCLVMIFLLFPWGAKQLQTQEPYTPVKITWYDVDELTGSRPNELHLIARGAGYESHVKLNKSNGWIGKIQYSNDFSSEKLLDEIDFDFTDGNGKDINYKEEINYENDALCVNLKYRVPFIVEWDDNNDAEGKRPESVYISMRGAGYGDSTFKCHFDYSGGKQTVPLEQGYMDGSVNVTVYTDESQSNVISDYVPSLFYDESTCTLTLTMSLETEKDLIPVQFGWYDGDNVTGNRPNAVNLIIETTDSSYSHTVTIKEEDDWQLEVPQNDKFLDEKYLKDEVEFSLTDVNGGKVPYHVNAAYRDGMLFLYARYDMPFEIVWDDSYHPHEVYVLLKGQHFSSGFTYTHPRTVRFYDEYVRGDVQVTVHDEWNREQILTDYVPTLLYNPEDCSITLAMELSKKNTLSH